MGTNTVGHSLRTTATCQEFTENSKRHWKDGIISKKKENDKENEVEYIPFNFKKPTNLN